MLHWEKFWSEESSKNFSMKISALLTLKIMEKHLKANYFILNQLSSNGKTPHKHVHLE